MTRSLRRNPIIRTIAILALALGFFAFAPSTAGAAVACDASPDWLASADNGEEGWEYGVTMTLTVNPSEASAGDQVTISGTGYPRNCDLEVFVDGESIGVAPTDGEGNFSINWTIPAGTEAGELEITTDVGGIVKMTTLTVLGAATPGTTVPGAVAPGTGSQGTGGTSAGILPTTGSQTLALLGGGVLLVVLGSMLVLANRKRVTA